MGCSTAVGRFCRHGLLTWAVCLSVGCDGGGGDNGNGGSDSPLPNGGGGKRLAWEQTAPSLAQLQAYQFMLWVDGSRTSPTDVQCGTRSAAGGYTCTAGLPAMSNGRHVLELSTMMNGAESGRSTPLVVVIEGSQVPPAPAPHPPVSGSTYSLGRKAVCLDAQGSDCSSAQTSPMLPGLVTAMAALPDDRLLILQDGRHVRVIIRDQLRDEPALTLGPESARLAGIAVGPDFLQTRAVFVGWTETLADGTRQFNVSRYREVNDLLGEGAVVISGLPLQSTGEAVFTIGHDGLIYVSLPTSEQESGARSPYDGFVLRFRSDGTVATSNRLASPIFARGYAEPTAIVFDAADSRLWLAGRDPVWPHRLAQVSTESSAVASWPQIPAPAIVGEPSERPFNRIVGVAIRATAGAGTRSFFLLDAEGALYNSAVDAGGKLHSLRSVSLGSAGPVAAMTTCGGGDELCLATRSTAGTTSFSTILRFRQR